MIVSKRKIKKKISKINDNILSLEIEKQNISLKLRDCRNDQWSKLADEHKLLVQLIHEQESIKKSLNELL